MVAPDSLMEPPKERSSSKDPNQALTNGNDATETTSQETAEVHKPPSYVALACCISGYTSLVYDKTRQDLRSRTASPIRVDGLRNPAYASDRSNFLTPAPRNRSVDRMQTQGKSNSYGLDFLNGCGGLHSPRHVANMTITKENINYKSSVVSESYSSYTNSSSRYTYSSSTPTSSPTVNGNTANGSKLITPTNLTQQLSPSSFIVQRVERLYGPGALAQGFYARKNTSTSRTSKNESISTTVSQTHVEKNDDGGLPVLKLLRPEFRAQLTVASRKGRSSLPEKSSSPEELKEMANLRMTDDVDASIQKPSAVNGEETKDGHYFLKLHAGQVKTLEALAEMAEKELQSCENEEAQGVLRAAAGKARLLIAQKLNQFKGLCQKNIEQSSTDDFPTTNEDLAGFWDMVMIQVDDVVSQCNKIKLLKKNDWKPEVEKTEDPKGSTPKVSATKKITPKKVDPKAKEASRARDEARRKMIEERRKAMKQQQQQGENNNDVIVV